MNYIRKAERTYNAVRQSLDNGNVIKLDKDGRRQAQYVSGNKLMALRASFCDFRKGVKA